MIRHWSPERSLQQRVVQQTLHRVLAFTGHNIDEVVNNPVVKNKVIGYYKLHKWVERGSEISELERQWNSLGN